MSVDRDGRQEKEKGDCPRLNSLLSFRPTIEPKEIRQKASSQWLSLCGVMIGLLHRIHPLPPPSSYNIVKDDRMPKLHPNAQCCFCIVPSVVAHTPYPLYDPSSAPPSLLCICSLFSLNHNLFSRSRSLSACISSRSWGMRCVCSGLGQKSGTAKRRSRFVP